MEQNFIADRIMAALNNLKKLCIKKRTQISDIYIGNADYNLSEKLDLKNVKFEKF